MNFGPKTLWNLSEAQLFEEAVRRKEGLVSSHGAFVVQTGVNTGRAAQDKFIVLDEITKEFYKPANKSPYEMGHQP